MTDEYEAAGEGQVWVCGACGKTSCTRDGFGDTACITWAVLCYERKDTTGPWVAVTNA